MIDSPKQKQKMANNNVDNDSEKYRGSALYGDLMNMIVGFIVTTIFGWKLYKLEMDDPKRGTAERVMMAYLMPFLFVIPAVLTKNLWLSRLAMIAVPCAMSFMVLSEWPYPGECGIELMLQGQVAMVVITNVSLSFFEKMMRLAFLFVIGSFVSIKSPNSVYLQDAFPVLGGTVLVAVFVLYVYHFGIGKQLASVQASRLVLAALFVYHMTVDMESLSSPENFGSGIASWLKVVVLGCIGIIATGSFGKEIQHNEELEILIKERTKEIRSQNKKLRMISMALHASETAIAITDNLGRIIWINSALENMCKKKEEVLIDTPLKDVIHKLDPTRKENRYIVFNTLEDSVNRSEEELLIGESIFRLETTPFLESNDEDGNETAVSASKECPPNDRFLVVFKDITAYRAREHAEKVAHDKAMIAKTMGDAMVTLTHELRTPLQGIMGVTSLLLQQASDLKSEMLESIKLIMASSSLLLNLINNLLDIKKVTAKMMEEFPMTSIMASGPIKDAVGFCHPLASISSVEIVSDLEFARHAFVRSNNIRLQQVLINLISNAIKYAKVGTEISISTQTSTIGDAEKIATGALACSPAIVRNSEVPKNNDESNTAEEQSLSSPVLIFSVSDCGAGIAPGQAGRLFHRFSQLDDKPKRTLGNEVGQPSGTGLGLNLCKLFVERMNGRIWANNNSSGSDNVGSTFSFYLPLLSIEQDCDPIVGLPAAIATATRRNSGIITTASDNNRLPRRRSISSLMNDMISLDERRVLLVDDTLINRKVILRMLKSIGVSNSVTVESGEKALEELSSNEYDLVITDLQMPGISGTELSDAIHNQYSSPPIVVGLTADTSFDVVEKCAASGMADVLYKPITLTEMRDYFETTVPRLESGVWYADVYDAQKDSLLGRAQ